LIKVSDGDAETIGFYKVTCFGHDTVKALKNDTDIPYRVSGKNLFLKSPEGHEVKAQLCEQRDEMVVAVKTSSPELNGRSRTGGNPCRGRPLACYTF
jgi:hypothetical protein